MHTEKLAAQASRTVVLAEQEEGRVWDDPTGERICVQWGQDIKLMSHAEFQSYVAMIATAQAKINPPQRAQLVALRPNR
jgi:hypothetical protein